MKYANPRSGLVVLRCGRDEWRQVWASASLVTHVRQTACSLELRRVSGSLAAARRAALALSGELCARLGGRGAAEQRAAADALRVIDAT